MYCTVDDTEILPGNLTSLIEKSTKTSASNTEKIRFYQYRK